jgi:hypothetical protein
MMIRCLILPTHWPPSQIETRYSNEDIEMIPFEIISQHFIRIQVMTKDCDN